MQKHHNCSIPQRGCDYKLNFCTLVDFQINEPNAYGNTPLHVACYNGQDVVVNELIECGANVNQVNEKGFAPLHFTAASRQGKLCLELLVCNGADVNIKVRERFLSAHHQRTSCK